MKDLSDGHQGSIHQRISIMEKQIVREFVARDGVIGTCHLNRHGVWVDFHPVSVTFCGGVFALWGRYGDVIRIAETGKTLLSTVEEKKPLYCYDPQKKEFVQTGCSVYIVEEWEHVVEFKGVTLSVREWFRRETEESKQEALQASSEKKKRADEVKASILADPLRGIPYSLIGRMRRKNADQVMPAEFQRAYAKEYGVCVGFWDYRWDEVAPLVKEACERRKLAKKAT